MASRLGDMGCTTDGHEPAHLAVELGKAVGLEAGVDPRLVVREVKLGGPDEEGVGTEAVERLQPAVGRLEVAGEGVNVGGTGGDDAPAIDTDSAHDGFPS